MKTCTRCHQSLPLDAFSKNSAAKDGKAGHCRECERARKAGHSAGYRMPPKAESAKARHERFQREQWERDSENFRRATSGGYRTSRPAPAAPSRGDWTVPNYRDTPTQAAAREKCAKLLFGADHPGSNPNEAKGWRAAAMRIKAKHNL